MKKVQFQQKEDSLFEQLVGIVLVFVPLLTIFLANAQVSISIEKAVLFYFVVPYLARSYCGEEYPKITFIILIFYMVIFGMIVKGVLTIAYIFSIIFVVITMIIGLIQSFVENVEYVKK